MKSLWAFAIGADESNSDGDSHLDCCIRFPPIVRFEGSYEVSNGFHLMAIPLFACAHTGQEYCDLVIKVLDVLCPDWWMKLIGSSTDGAGNMAGHNSGFSTLLRNESECREAFYRVWCLAHQLDLVIKASVNRIGETGVFAFVSKLTEIIGYLWRQKWLIQDMGAKCPYFIQVHWKSLAKMLKWLTTHQSKVLSFVKENQYAGAPMTVWWLVEKVCLNFLKDVMVTFDALQKSNVHVSQQVENIERLADELRENCGATMDESITESSNICQVAASGNAIKMGPYIVMRDSLKNSIISMGVAAMDEFNSLDQARQITVL